MEEGVRMDEESVAEAEDVALADAPPVAERPGALTIAGIVAVDWVH